jgi:hypothetical protein
MGLTRVQVKVANPEAPRRSARVVCLVDSGAVYSVIPAGHPAPYRYRAAFHPHVHPR